jgi:hypothetical protein
MSVDSYVIPIHTRDKSYSAEWYIPGVTKPIKNADFIGIDSETEEIQKGSPIIPVLATVCDDNAGVIHIVHVAYWGDYFRELDENNPGSKWIFHNAPFDIFVLGDPRTDCRYLLKKLLDKEIIDTQVKFILHTMAHGTFVGLSSLDYACLTMLRIKVDKDKNIRLTFKLMDGDKYWMPSTEHLVYACLDTAYTCQLYKMLNREYPTEFICLYGKLVLYDISLRGMYVDSNERQRLYTKINDSIQLKLKELEYFNWRPGESSDKELQRRLEFMEQVFNITLPRTAGNKGTVARKKADGTIIRATPPKPPRIKTTDEALATIPNDYTFIKLYKEYKHLNKMLITYLSDNTVQEDGTIIYDRIGRDGRVHPTYRDMVKTGRTSCSYPNLQNVPRKEGLRGIYKAPEGKLLFACDYSQAELCALAQTCYTRYNFSVMLDVINSGVDLHVWLGQKIFKLFERATDEDWEKLPADDSEGVRGKAWYRQIAKALNFGKPGGLSAKTFVTYARNYGVDITIEEAEELLDLWVTSFPEMKYHLSPLEGGTREVKISSTEKKIEKAYIASTITNRIKTKSGYCAACNYPFQGLVADGIKLAMWYLWLEGFEMVNMVHDELLFELEENDPKLQEKIKRIKELMLFGMRIVLPNVTGLKCEGTLMRRWRKEAKEIIHPVLKETLIWEDAVEFGWVVDKKLKIPESQLQLNKPPKAKVY